MLEETQHEQHDDQATDVALGFDSQQSFNRSFKRQFGQAPGAWRRSIGNPDTTGLRQPTPPFSD